MRDAPRLLSLPANSRPPVCLGTTEFDGRHGPHAPAVACPRSTCVAACVTFLVLACWSWLTSGGCGDCCPAGVRVQGLDSGGQGWPCLGAAPGRRFHAAQLCQAELCQAESAAGPTRAPSSARPATRPQRAGTGREGRVHCTAMPVVTPQASHRHWHCTGTGNPAHTPVSWSLGLFYTLSLLLIFPCGARSLSSAGSSRGQHLT